MNRAVLLRLLTRALEELAGMKARERIAERRERARAFVIAARELLCRAPDDVRK